MSKRTGEKTSSTHVCQHPFEKLRRENAKNRQKERDKRSPKEQLKLLDDRLGVNMGAKRERSRLLEWLSKDKEKKS